MLFALHVLNLSCLESNRLTLHGHRRGLLCASHRAGFDHSRSRSQQMCVTFVDSAQRDPALDSVVLGFFELVLLGSLPAPSTARLCQCSCVGSSILPPTRCSSIRKVDFVSAAHPASMPNCQRKYWMFKWDLGVVHAFNVEKSCASDSLQ